MKALQAQIEELQQMLLEQQVATTSAQVNRVSVKLPPFWKDKPSLWFVQAEAQFSLG